MVGCFAALMGNEVKIDIGPGAHVCASGKQAQSLTSLGALLRSLAMRCQNKRVAAPGSASALQVPVVTLRRYGSRKRPSTFYMSGPVKHVR